MKALKRIGVVICAVVLTFGATACRKLYDVAPKTYGEWDGNYIYAGNVRCKTTGEEESYLVETLTKDGEEYSVAETTDYEYVGDDIYMCLALQGEDEETSSSSCFVRYDVAEKTTDVIYWASEKNLAAHRIYKMRETFVVLCTTQYSDTRTLFKIDYDGNVLSENEDYLSELTQTGEYLVGFDSYKQTVYYRTWEETEFTYAQTLSPLASDWIQSLVAEYVEQDGRKGFLLRTMMQDKWRGVYFYDITARTTTKLLEIDFQYELFEEDGYVMTGKPVEEEYRVVSNTWTLDGFIRKNKQETHTFTHYMWQNCKLYRIDYVNMALVTTYDFSKDDATRDFSNMTVLDGERIYFETNKVVRGGTGCRGDESDKVEERSYLLNLSTGELTTKKAATAYSNWRSEQQEKRRMDDAAKCGEYAYYFEIDGYGGWVVNKVCTLYRYHLETQKKDAMQFWEEESVQGVSGSYQTGEGDEIVTFRFSPMLRTVYVEKADYTDVDSRMILVRNY